MRGHNPGCRVGRRDPGAATRPAAVGRLRVWLALAALLMFAPGTGGGVAAARGAADPVPDVRVLALQQQDLDGDGNPDLATIDCSIATPHDRVLVYDSAGDMRSSTTWEGATDFANDTWIFDIGGRRGDGQATLIIAFATEQGKTTARIYTGSTTDGIVRYSVQDKRVRVVEPAHAALTIEAQGGWLTRGGALNYNLDWYYSGAPPNADLQDVARRYPGYFVLNGTRTYEGQVRDIGQDGIPDFLWTTLIAPLWEGEGVPRTGIQVNSGGHRPSEPTHAIFWPLLNRPDDSSGSNYFDTPLALRIDWSSGDILGLGFSGYPIEDGYHVNSTSRLHGGRENVLSFENPMAYYDLARDRDGLPELFIRFAFTPPGDPYYTGRGPTKTPIQMVQYSWNQQEVKDLRWSYKVDVAGVNPIETTVRLGELAIQQVPHEALPGWVMAHPWAFGTFVAYESGEGYRSSEGLYEWSTLEGVDRYLATGFDDMGYFNDSAARQRAYITGADPRSPADLYTGMRSGFRGEYANLNGPVALYFSPVDARLHLVGATRGVYNVDNNRRVEYRNLGGEGIDSWRLYAGDRAVSHLVQAPDFLLYGSEQEVRLRRSTVPRELFRAQPPTDHDEFVALGAQIRANGRAFSADDLEAMFTQFGGAELRISNASLFDYRSLGGGAFRFVLDLGAGFRQDGHALFDLSGLPPGRYVVSFDGQFTVAPLSPPVLSAAIADTPLRQFAQNRVTLTLRNEGLEDQPQATLELWAVPPQGVEQRVAAQPVALLGRDSTMVRLVWVPPVPGEWELTVRVRTPGSEPTTLTGQTVTVLPVGRASAGAVLGASGRGVAQPVAFTVLILLALAAAVAFVHGWRLPARNARGLPDDGRADGDDPARLPKGGMRWW